MKNILFTNGCSWTYGGGLDSDHPSESELAKKVWPHHLKINMGFSQHVNLASGCGSNQRIVRTTIDWLTKQDKELLKNTVAVIQWTEWSRYEYYVPKTNRPFDDEPNRWALCKVGNCISKAETGDINYTNKRNDMRFETYSTLEGYYTHLMHCETLASMFNKFGVKYYYWNFVTPMFALPDNLKSLLLDNYNWLEPLGRHEWVYERLNNDPHPSETGHIQLSEHIKNAIKDLKYYDSVL